MFSRFFSALAFTLLTVSNLVAQADAAPVESPQRGATHTDDGGIWYQEPIFWIGSLVVLLVVVLLVLRRKNAPTGGWQSR